MPVFYSSHSARQVIRRTLHQATVLLNLVGRARVSDTLRPVRPIDFVCNTSWACCYSQVSAPPV
jgi:hypothetical protein